MRTIEQLNTLLEELEKRIRNISTAQSTLSQINAICTYIANVQDYLQKLNTAFDTHVQECDDYTDDINNLQTQIDTINESINSLISDDKTIQQIQTSLAELQAEIEAFVGNSSTTAETLQNDISALQTDLGSCQDDIADVESEISAINSSIGEQNTTITNLQTTQTNLQTTQSSQASTINNINSRLTTAENNISTLTGGVDLTEYDNRLSAIEPVNNLFQSYVHKKYNFHNASPEDFTVSTREYTYTCKPNVYVYQEFKISYEFSGEGSMTVEMYENNEATGEVYTIDLAQNPTECVLYRELCPQNRANNFMLKCVASGAITYKTIDITMHGEELYIFEGNQDLKVVCFNNYIYITRYYDDCVKYGKFAPTDTIEIDNLPNSRPYNDVHGWHNYILFSPFPFSTYPYTTFYKINDDFMLKVSHNNVFNSISAARALTDGTSELQNPMISCSNEIFPCIYPYTFSPTIKNSIVTLSSINIPNRYYDQNYVIIDGVKEWLYCNIVNYNNQIETSSPIESKYMATIALADDGCFYLLKNRDSNNPHYCKICKGGIYATAYMQEDESINVYISFANYVEQYTITKDSNGYYKDCSFVKTIQNCNCVYELLNDLKIKHTTKGWILEKIETTTEETIVE